MLILVFFQHARQPAASSRQHPPPPFNKSYQMIVLTGGKVYGIPNTNSTTKEHVFKPQKVDIVIAAERIFALMNPSETISFVNYMKKQNFQILSVSVQDQLVMPGLIDPHIHAIGGGGEQGMFKVRFDEFFSNKILFSYRSVFSNS